MAAGLKGPPPFQLWMKRLNNSIFEMG